MFHKPNYTRYRQPIHGFTLVELLVVISIIALLLSILMPSLQKARSQAASVVCKSNIKQIGITLNMYTLEHSDYLPKLDRSTGVGWFYQQQLGQYVGQKKHSGFKDKDKLHKVFSCPADKGLSNYPNSQYMGEVISYSPPWEWADHKLYKITEFKHPGSYLAFLEKGDSPDLAWWQCHRYYTGWSSAELEQIWAAVKRHMGKINILYLDNHAEQKKFASFEDLPSDSRDPFWAGNE